MDPEKFNLNRDDLHTIVKRKYSNPKLQFEIKTAEVIPFSTSRVGYLGDHFLLELTVLLNASNREEKLSFFFKVLPTGIPSLTTYLLAIGSFHKEVHLYGELFPRLARFTRFAAASYLAKDDRLLVFENLAVQGFRTVNSSGELGIFDKAHLEQALRALAKFHSASLLEETRTGRTVAELCEGALDENCWIRKDGNPRVEELENAIEVLCKLVKVIEKDNARLESILARIPEFILQIYDLVKPSDVYRNVASHGDLWGSNLMFKYSDEGRPVDCLIVDFQFARYAPPAYDVHMLITLTTTGEFRRQHYKELIDLYYKTVRQELIDQRVSPDEIFPEKEFFESCPKYRISGLIDNFLMNHVTLLPRSYVDKTFSSPDEYNNFSGQDKIRMCLDVLQNNAEYRARITGVIKDLLEAL